MLEKADSLEGEVLVAFLALVSAVFRENLDFRTFKIPKSLRRPPNGRRDDLFPLADKFSALSESLGDRVIALFCSQGWFSKRR